MSSLKARSYGAIFFVNATAIKKGLCGCQWDCSHGVTEMHLCAMLHTNGFHTHSVWFQCAIPICIYTDCSHTVWTNSLKLQEKIVIKYLRKRNKSHRVNEPLEPRALFYTSSSRYVATGALHHNGQYMCTQYGKPFSGEIAVIGTLFSEMRPWLKVCSYGAIDTAIYFIVIVHTAILTMTLRSIHTCDLLGINYCVNYSLNNGLYQVGTFTLAIWVTFAWTKKFNKGLYTQFFHDCMD